MLLLILTCLGVLQEVEEAIAMANDTPFGLAAYVFTQNLSRAFQVSEAIEAGMVSVNEGILSTAGWSLTGLKMVYMAAS